MNINKETLEYMKSKGIPLPPEDSKCEVCGKKVSVLIPVEGKWVCKYLICEQKAKGVYVEETTNKEMFQ